MSVRLSDWLLPYQRRFAEAPQKRKIYLSARQAGKSFVLAYMALKKALTNPAQAVLCISTGQRAASEFLQKVARWADAAKIASSGALDFQASADCVKLGNGGRVLSLPSGNPSALRGYTAPLVVIDEAAYLENADEVFQAIAPTLTRNKDAELVVASTPAGCAGLFWDLWCQAEADPGWYRQTTTIEDAVAEGLDVDVEELKALCPDPAVFDVEYMCRFSKEVGSFVDPGAVVYEDPARPGGRYVLGADFGRKNDATAFAVLRDFGDKAFLEDVVTMTGADWESQFRALKELNDKYKFGAGYMDANGIGSALSEQAQKKLNQRLRPFTTTASNKTDMYEYAKGRIYDKKLFVNPQLKDMLEKDLRNVRRVVSDAGKVAYSAGRASGHSDATSALVFALWAARDMPLTFSRPAGYSPRSVFC